MCALERGRERMREMREREGERGEGEREKGREDKRVAERLRGRQREGAEFGSPTLT